MSAEEALARAKAIAARLSGQTVLSTPAASLAASASSAGTADAAAGKRKRWGVAPPGVTATGTVAAVDGDASSPSKRPKQEALDTKRIWVSTSEIRPSRHFVLFLRDKLPSVCDKYKVAPDSALSISLKGKGSSTAPPIPGMPEQPLHVLVEGTKQEIDIVDTEIDVLLREAEQAAPLASAEDEEVDNSQALTAVGGFSGNGNHDSYRPASVAQMIGQAALPAATADWISSEVQVPNGVVGFIIGRGGENIASMQAKTGTKVQIQKENELQPGQTARTIYLQAPNAQSLEECRTIILNMVREKTQHSSRPASKDERLLQEAIQQGHAHIPVDVPDADVGLVIGKQGMTIRNIQETTGASIQVPHSTPGAVTRTLNITHPNMAGAEQAKQMVLNVLATKVQHGGVGTNGGATATGGVPQASIQVQIPDKDVGLCIGRQGCVIREMQGKTRTRIQIPNQAVPGEAYRIATVTGPKEGCEEVKAMIQAISAAQSSVPVMSGTYNQQHQHQQQTYGQYGSHGAPQQQQHSAEWAAYYAAQAAAQAQQQQQQHSVQQASAPDAAPAAAASSAVSGQQQPASDAYHEQFFRYAYYYGEDAARKHYGAWAPPVGTPNPYGVNPNGTTAPPASAPAAASPSVPVTQAPAAVSEQAPTAASTSSAKETGRRKVSNLPAWMTKGQG